MMPTVLALDHPETAPSVDIALETGQTIIFPTDTVYGIGGNPWDERTLHHVCRLKGRDLQQPFTLHLRNVSEIGRYAQCTQTLTRLVEMLLPGPYTLLLPASKAAPRSAVFDGKVGIRVPDHRFFSEVLRRPVFATSVNRHNEPPLNDVAEIIEAFSEVSLIITGDVSGAPSAVLDLSQHPYRLIRGTLSADVQEQLDQE